MKRVTMDLIVWRHAEAEDRAPEGGDLARRLTARGRQQAARMAAWLDPRLPDDARLLASPALRCQETIAALGRRHETLEALRPDVPPDNLLDVAAWPHGRGTVLVVGHQPTLGLAIAQALTGRAQAWTVKKGGLWWLRWRDRDEDGDVFVHVALTPDSL